MEQQNKADFEAIKIVKGWLKALGYDAVTHKASNGREVIGFGVINGKKTSKSKHADVVGVFDFNRGRCTLMVRGNIDACVRPDQVTELCRYVNTTNARLAVPLFRVTDTDNYLEAACAIPYAALPDKEAFEVLLNGTLSAYSMFAPPMLATVNMTRHDMLNKLKNMLGINDDDDDDDDKIEHENKHVSLKDMLESEGSADGESVLDNSDQKVVKLPSLAEMFSQLCGDDKPKRKPGRPKGSKNKKTRR